MTPEAEKWHNNLSLCGGGTPLRLWCAKHGKIAHNADFVTFFSKSAKDGQSVANRVSRAEKRSRAEKGEAEPIKL